MAEIRALLLTDVLDSTRLAQQLGEAELAALWLAHDRLARDLLPAWRGREIDKTDGFLLLFADAGDAVGYAMAYHRALAALGVALQARAGLHLVAHYGWPGLGERIALRCFSSEPSVASSLKFLRRTPWARAKVEALDLSMLRDVRRSQPQDRQ